MPARRVIVALVRHGDYHQPSGVPSAQLPHPLTDKGVEQAEALAGRLLTECEALGVELAPVLDASTLRRASQTAAIAAAKLSEALDRPLTTAAFAELGERSVGAAANLHVDRIAEIIAADPRHPPLPIGWKAHPRVRLPFVGAESLMMAGARVAAHIEGRALQLGHDPTAPDAALKVFVSHGGALRHAAVCMGALDLAEVPDLSMHHCGYVLLEHADGPGHPGPWRKVGGDWKIRPAAQAVD